MYHRKGTDVRGRFRDELLGRDTLELFVAGLAGNKVSLLDLAFGQIKRPEQNATGER